MKRKTPKEIIEKGGSPEKEQAYMKFPREELIPTTQKSGERGITRDLKLIGQLFKEKGYKKFTDLHTHPYCKDPLNAMPSASDLNSFYFDTRRKNAVIAQRDAETGELQGYTYLLKEKEESPRHLPFSLKKLMEKLLKGKEPTTKEIDKKATEVQKEFESYERDSTPSNVYNNLKEIAKEHDWKVRFIPAKGYHLSKKTGNFEKTKGIEKIIAISLSLVGFFIVLYSLGSMTGFAISQINQVKLNYRLVAGIIITLAGLIYAKRVLR